MVVSKGEMTFVRKNEEETYLKQSLKFTLKNWFNLKLKDFPGVVRSIGVDAIEYTVKMKEYENDHLDVIVKISENDEFVMRLFRGNMISPYPALIINDGKTEKWYSIRKEVVATFIM